MKLVIDSVPVGLRTLNMVEADVFKADDRVILMTNDEAFDYKLELDYSMLLTFHFKLLKVLRENRTRGSIIQLIKDECDKCPKDRIRIIWDAGVTMKIYQRLSTILRSRLSSHARLPDLQNDSQS
jgi:hypothetical protein